MSPPLRPGASIPVLILTDEDYRRAFAADESVRAAVVAAVAEPGIPPPSGRRRSRVLPAAAAAVVLAASGAALWLAHEKPRPVAVAVEAPPAVRPRPVPPPVVEPPPAPPSPPPAAALVVAVEEEDPPAAEPVPAPPPPPPPWYGGRAWVRLQLRWEHRAQVQESERRVVFVGEGSRYVLERPGAERADLWLDRLDLLFRLPEEHESWRRQVTGTGTETLHLPKGDLACRVVEGQDQFPQGMRRFRYWYSDEFPAGAVRAEQTLGDLVFSCRVLDFGPEPPRKP